MDVNPSQSSAPRARRGEPCHGGRVRSSCRCARCRLLGHHRDRRRHFASLLRRQARRLMCLRVRISASPGWTAATPPAVRRQPGTSPHERVLGHCPTGGYVCLRPSTCFRAETDSIEILKIGRTIKIAPDQFPAAKLTSPNTSKAIDPIRSTQTRQEGSEPRRPSARSDQGSRRRGSRHHRFSVTCIACHPPVQNRGTAPTCRSAVLPPPVGRPRRQRAQRHRSLARARPRPSGAGNRD